MPTVVSDVPIVVFGVHAGVSDVPKGVSDVPSGVFGLHSDVPRGPRAVLFGSRGAPDYQIGVYCCRLVLSDVHHVLLVLTLCVEIVPARCSQLSRAV